MSHIFRISIYVATSIGFATTTSGQTPIDSTECKSFWSECIDPIIAKDSVRLARVVHFPLHGDWGYMVGLEKEESLWTEADFFDHLDSLFHPKLIDELRRMGPRSVVVHDLGNDDPELHVIIPFSNWIDEFKDESSVILRFREVLGHWKLWTIQAAD